MLGTTFGGNHLACAAAIAVLDVMDQENLVENAAKVGEYLISELRKMPKVTDVRGKGLMIGFEMEGFTPRRTAQETPFRASYLHKRCRTVHSASSSRALNIYGRG